MAGSQGSGKSTLIAQKQHLQRLTGSQRVFRRVFFDPYKLPVKPLVSGPAVIHWSLAGEDRLWESWLDATSSWFPRIAGCLLLIASSAAYEHRLQLRRERQLGCQHLPIASKDLCKMLMFWRDLCDKRGIPVVGIDSSDREYRRLWVTTRTIHGLLQRDHIVRKTK